MKKEDESFVNDSALYGESTHVYSMSQFLKKISVHKCFHGNFVSASELFVYCDFIPLQKALYPHQGHGEV